MLKSSIVKGGWTVVCMSLAACACAFAPVPDEAKCLGRTKGKPFSSGIVFVNGRYLPPPYRVERVGNAIFINRRQVTGQVIDWREFVKTQEWAEEALGESRADEPPEKAREPQKTKTARAAEAGEVVRADTKNEEENAVDDLFADDEEDVENEKPAAAPKREPPAAATVKRDEPAPAPKTTKRHKFVMNAQAKKLVDRIRTVRTNIDKTLRMGGFICFGDKYSRISGDKPIARLLIAELPKAQKTSSGARELESKLRSAGLEFVSYDLCNDFYKNRFDYLKLQKINEDIKLGLDL